jgi:hypothetical protein
MTATKFSVGNRVRFRGTADSDGNLTSACASGPDVFEATIANMPYGVCYGLEWDDGSPVGIPFHDCNLEPVTERRSMDFDTALRVFVIRLGSHCRALCYQVP